MLADHRICVLSNDLFFCRRKRSFISIICPGASPRGGIRGNPVKIGSGPATVSSDDPHYGLGISPALPTPDPGSPATVHTMGRHGREDDLQARRPARVRPAASSTVKKAEVSVYMRIIKTVNPRPHSCGRGFFVRDAAVLWIWRTDRYFLRK